MPNKLMPSLRRQLLIVGTSAVVISAGALLNASLPGAPAAIAADAAPAPPPSAQPDTQRREHPRERMRERWAEMDRHLSADQVRDIVAGKLAMSGDDNLKVGKATAEGNDAVAVEITTKTGAVVSSKEYSTKTGLPLWLSNRLTSPPTERRFAEHRPEERAMHHGGWRHEAGTWSWLGAGPDHDLKLTADEARRLAEARLITLGNGHLKVGAVREKDADTITVDIVAADNSLVAQESLNRHTGRPEHNRT